MRRFSFTEISSSPLIIDAIYEGGDQNHSGDDPISKMFPGVGNQGGFRISYKNNSRKPAYVVLYTSGKEIEWPDYLDIETGMFRYYGDNRKPGYPLHETPKGGNALLRDTFNLLLATPNERRNIPPFFILEKVGEGRSVRFRGLAAPGSKHFPPDNALVAIWRTKENTRFQNYEAYFTILDSSDEPIPKEWLQALKNETGEEKIFEPDVWKKFINEGLQGIKPLHAPKIKIPSKSDQLPSDDYGRELLFTIYDYFKDNPYKFEAFAVELAKMIDNHFFEFDLTRPWRDGGRDAIGKYLIGHERGKLFVECALEAKCYNYDNSIGVKQTSRLISRLRYRQFGILVTTSFVDRQAYLEIKEDGHPVLLISGGDIVDVLKRNNMNRDDLIKWLENFER